MDAAAIHKLSSDGGAVVMQEQVQVRSPPDASDLLHDIRVFSAGSGQVMQGLSSCSPKRECVLVWRTVIPFRGALGDGGNLLRVKHMRALLYALMERPQVITQPSKLLQPLVLLPCQQR